MQDPEHVSASGREMVEALQSLELAPLPSSPRAIWYQAGFEAGRRQARVWRAVAAIVFIACGLAVTWDVQRPTVNSVAQIHPLTPATSTVNPPDDHPSSTDFAARARLRNALVQQELDALSSKKIGSTGYATFSPTGWCPPNERGS